jgi:integrase
MVFSYALEEGMMLENPAAKVRRIRVPKASVHPPTIEHFFAVLAYLRKTRRRRHAANMVELLAYSGVRLMEGAFLDWRDIDWQRKLVHVTGGERGTKNRQARWIPLFPDFAEFLLRLGPRKAGRVLATFDCGHAIDLACAALKLPRFTHHELRHFFATNAIENGRTFQEVGAWLGHSDGGMLAASTYGHLRRETESESAASFSIKASVPVQQDGQLSSAVA